ncbi:lactate permease [Enhydrobacter aerosaccus]|uniref:L-lactate permease n=1 Tax=Enhydrobacter aerosaccus TaxID=225324 RepID=A0A1T4SUQ6_9HYPH|nr:L-lactate permease [Enhydrobacter aerosaccus]SKA31648.1 lactate permease [Enhydrobacter aerosaccus]
MSTALALLPLLLVLVLLASGRASALTAGIVGLAATIAVAGAAPSLLAREIPAGLWLSGQVIAIIATGIFFHHCLQARGEAAATAATEATPRRLWALCFLIAPFTESVTGFGVGYMIALAALRRFGLPGLPTLLLGLYSQTLVPWGALAIGTTVGAALAGLAPQQLGLASALLQVPIHALYLVLYWRFARTAGVAVSAAQKLDDIGWTALLLLMVCLANRYGDVEIAGAAPTALLAALRFWRDERPDAKRLRHVLRVNGPYIALTLALCATRLVPPLRDFLKPLWAVKPFDNQPAFAPLYAPGFWLISVGVIVVLASRASLPRVIAAAAKGAWRASAVTLAFVVMAELYVGSGMAQQIATALEAAAGPGAAFGVPLFAAIGGFLTGGGSAANAMLMPMVTALARAVALDPAWIAAVQNSLCTNLTMLSPIRISMGAALLGLTVSDAELYRRAWPLALPPLITGIAAIALLLAASASL